MTLAGGIVVIAAITWASLASGSSNRHRDSTATTISTSQNQIPSNRIPYDISPASGCRAVLDVLAIYRQNAVDGGPSNLAELSRGLEEFESEIDFIGKGADWSIAIVEQTYQVRRDWVTAFSADLAGEDSESQARQESALEYLDTALAVECPA